MKSANNPFNVMQQNRRDYVGSSSSTTTTTGVTRNCTQRFMQMRDQYSSGSDRRGPDQLEVIGASRLLEAAIDSTSSHQLNDNSSTADIHGINKNNNEGQRVLPPAWVDVCEQIARDMEKANKKIDMLQKAQQKALLPTFDDVAEDERVVEDLTGECGRLFKRCEAQLKRLGSDAEVGGVDDRERMKFDDVGTKMRKNATRKLAMELSKLSQAFRQRQKEYLRELKNRQDRGPGAEGVDALEEVFRSRNSRQKTSNTHLGGGGGFLLGADEDEQFVTSSSSSSHQRQQQQQQQSLYAPNRDVISLEAEERDTEVKKILESVTDLAMVMQDMSKLIIDQGTILESIEYNCATTSMVVDEGRKELVKAEKTQRAGGVIMCIYFLMAMCVLMTIIIILQKL